MTGLRALFVFAALIGVVMVLAGSGQAHGPVQLDPGHDEPGFWELVETPIYILTADLTMSGFCLLVGRRGVGPADQVMAERIRPLLAAGDRLLSAQGPMRLPMTVQGALPLIQVMALVLIPLSFLGYDYLGNYTLMVFLIAFVVLFVMIFIYQLLKAGSTMYGVSRDEVILVRGGWSKKVVRIPRDQVGIPWLRPRTGFHWFAGHELILPVTAAGRTGEVVLKYLGQAEAEDLMVALGQGPTSEVGETGA